MKLSPHFYAQEFSCRCGCGAHEVSQKLLDALELIRSKAGAVSITVVSGRRCPRHNAKVGGASHSQHLLGTAADIRHQSMMPQRLHALIADLHNQGLVHIGGLGLYKTFVHVDVRDGVARWND